jgi:hypothetical protein
MNYFSSHSRLHSQLLVGAYSWLTFSAFLHFAIDVVSQYVRGKRLPGPATTLYYGLNCTYAVSQVLFAALALLAIHQGMTSMGHWPGITLGLIAACAWFGLSWMFLGYWQPRMAVLVFATLLVGAAVTA